MNEGGIAGIVIAIIAVIIVCAVVVICYLNKRKKGDFLLEEMPEKTMKVAYANNGFSGGGEGVNVIDYTEIPFTVHGPAETQRGVDQTPFRHQQPRMVSDGTLRVKIREDGDYATIGTRVSVDVTELPSEEPSRLPENCGSMHTVMESDFQDMDGDYATLDSVTRKRLETAAADMKKDSSHVTVTQSTLANLPDKENECEYATVVPRSLRRKNNVRVTSGVHSVNSDECPESFQAVDIDITSKHSNYLPQTFQTMDMDITSKQNDHLPQTFQTMDMDITSKQNDHLPQTFQTLDMDMYKQTDHLPNIEHF